MQAWWKIPVVIVAIIAAGVLIGWLGSLGPAPKTSSAPAGQPAPAVSANEATAQPSVPAGNFGPSNFPNPPPPPPVAVVPQTNWEEQVQAILDSDTDDTNKTAQLIALLPHLPAGVQLEVAQDLSNLVDDRDYAPLGQLLLNDQLSASALDVLMTDALSRPDALKLPLLLQLAQDPGHPDAGEAREMLGFYLDADYGSNWDLWQQKIQTWLQENPD